MVVREQLSIVAVIASVLSELKDISSLKHILNEDILLCKLL